ncbi:15619_t:CDS:2 [Cetraspora pellucida]|uniref:15619_t:CDS:1 n=1 Tax=Cetraspora pellucida TaxID=1433469 RepID=A0A9N9IWV3_9GLOM|nr:15619_t:CDS:2 [Cetraspora pellucida]
MVSEDNDSMVDLFGGRREKARLAAQRFSSTRNKRMRITQDHNFVKNDSQEKQQVQFPLFQGVQPVIPTLIQPQSLVQLWNMSTSQSLVSPSLSEQQVSQGIFTCNSVNSLQLQQFNERFRLSSGNVGVNSKAIKYYLDFSSTNVSYKYWIRNLALVVLELEL